MIIAGKYRVDEGLGQGGMGFVVAATHCELKKKYAIKLLREDAVANEDAVRRFVQEARAASQLVSEHVVKVYDIGKLESGVPYIVMEHLDGSDLGDVLESDGPMPAGEVARYLIQACEALAEAHSLGIVHRDLKPSNLFLVAERGGPKRIKILDFGISKMSGLTAAGEDGSITATDATLGSPAYMSPEQVRSTKGVDARTDIWSIGVILYELVTGSSPFKGATVGQTLARVLEISPPPPSRRNPAVSAKLDAVILRCLKREPAERYADVADLARALLPFASEDLRPLVDRAARLLGGAVVSHGSSTPPAPQSSEREDQPKATQTAETQTAESPMEGAGATRAWRKRLAVVIALAALAGGGLAVALYSYRTTPADGADQARNELDRPADEPTGAPGKSDSAGVGPQVVTHSEGEGHGEKNAGLVPTESRPSVVHAPPAAARPGLLDPPAPSKAASKRPGSPGGTAGVPSTPPASPPSAGSSIVGQNPSAPPAAKPGDIWEELP